MKIVCIAKEPKQDKNTGKWYLNGKEYEVTSKRGKELIATGYFEEVKEVKEAKVENVENIVEN